jgi:hypothetical protein
LRSTNKGKFLDINKANYFLFELNSFLTEKTPERFTWIKEIRNETSLAANSIMRDHSISL